MTSNAHDFLDFLNRKFLPVRVSIDSSDRHRVDDHVRELLELFKTESDHPFDLVGPIFYQIHDWRKDTPASRKRAGSVQWYGRVKWMNDRLNAQLSWSEPRDPVHRRGVTSRVMDAVNASDKLARVLLIIQPEGFEIPENVFDVWTSRMALAFTVSRETMSSNSGKSGLRIDLLDGSSVGQVDEYKRTGRTFWGKASEGNYASFSVYPDFWYLHEEAEILNKLARDLEGFIDDHSVYIDSSHTLIYVFSSIVQIGAEQQKGCGGLFLSVRNEALGTLDQWISLVERLADKVANRVVHQMQLDEMEHHALNSAITQTAARNYAHHIGAHVKMRTTPQEIKKRIKELYTGQFNGI